MPETSQTTKSTQAQDNKAVCRRWIEDFNARNDVGEAAARSADYIAHAPASIEASPQDSDGWLELLAGFTEGFPDLRITIEDAVGDAELVAQRVRFEGTHTGSFQGLPPTGKAVAFDGMEFNRMVDGKVAEHWFQLDQVTMLKQLGLTVVPGPRLVPRLLGNAVTKVFRRGAQ